MNNSTRRDFLRQSAVFGAATLLGNAVNGSLSPSLAAGGEQAGQKIRLGLCTYLWGQDWDLPTVIANCEKADVLGVELRVQHKHGVGPALNSQQREEVKKRFADSRVTFVGLGTNECFDSPNPEKVKKSIEAAKAFLNLSRDCGASGVKVKPNDFQKDVPHEKTIEQIGRSLNVLGKYAADVGQQVRLEVHGQCCELPTIKAIMDIADHPSVAVCWNSNKADLGGDGLEANFKRVEKRLGATCHIHELESESYPFQQLFDLFVKADYHGWLLLECASKPADPVAAMAAQRVLFDRMLAKAIAGGRA